MPPPPDDDEQPLPGPDLNPTGSEIVINGKGYDASPLVVHNWLDKEWKEFHFTNQRRSGVITEIIVHETVTRSHDDTVRVLEPPTVDDPAGRNLGVHFIIESDGTVFQHGDVATDLLWHASQHNGPSVGIEVVNPYEPDLAPKNGAWTTVIDAPWSASAHPPRKYLVPTPAQSEALFTLVMFLLGGGGDPAAPELNIPMKWIGLVGGKMALGRVAGADKLSPGIYAHHYFNHGDGAWLVLYCWLRSVAGMAPGTAYAEAIRRATGASPQGADLTDLLPGENSG